MLFLLATTALADTQSLETRSLEYGITAAGLPVGTRSLKITYLPGPQGEQRLLECYTEIPIAGFSQRVSGLSADSLPPGFSATNAQSGESWEVQAVRNSGGLQVHFVDARGTQSSQLAFHQVSTTSLALMDPERSLGQASQLDMLSAETGEILTGPLQLLGSETVLVGGESLPAQHYLWTPETGPVHLYYGAQGVLLQTRTRVAGQQVELTLTQPPASRVLDLDLDLGPAVQEESL